MKYFSPKEVDCPCCGGLPKEAMLIKLDQIREEWGKPLTVTSGYRCPQYNRKIKGAQKSAHCEGKAIDVADVKGDLYEWLVANADRLNIWLEDRRDAPSWCHISIRPGVSGRVFRA